MSSDGLLTGGGIAGGIASVVLVGRLALDAWRARREHPNTPPRIAPAVADAEATNALLLSALREERREVKRLSSRVSELELHNTALYTQIRTQREEYEREVAGLRAQLRDLIDRLDAFQQRLSDDHPAKGEKG